MKLERKIKSKQWNSLNSIRIKWLENKMKWNFPFPKRALPIANKNVWFVPEKKQQQQKQNVQIMKYYNVLQLEIVQKNLK